MEELSALRSLLKHKKADACTVLAREFLADKDRSPEERAECRAILCRSLVDEKKYMEVVEEGPVAAHTALELGLYDAAADALRALSTAQYYLGRQEEGVSTLKRLKDIVGLLKVNRDLEGYVLLNLGNYLKALRRHQESVAFLKQAFDWFRSRNPQVAEVARGAAAWEAIQGGDMALADRLIPLGAEYIKEHPEDTTALCMHLAVLSRWHLCKGEIGEAVAHAVECIARSDAHPDERTLALLTLAQSGMNEGRAHAAYMAAVLAKVAAEAGGCPDLISETQHLIAYLTATQPRCVREVTESLIGIRAAQSGRGEIV